MKEFLDNYKVGITSEDVYFSFLPLAHIFDRCTGPRVSTKPSGDAAKARNTTFC
jgi:long-subunit acyl-CoA synthetase (AMP-forming)